MKVLINSIDFRYLDINNLSNTEIQHILDKVKVNYSLIIKDNKISGVKTISHFNKNTTFKEIAEIIEKQIKEGLNETSK